MGRIVLWSKAKILNFEDVRWPELTIETSSGDIHRVRIGVNKNLPAEGNYGRDAAVAKVEALESTVVDIWVHESPWRWETKSGIVYYLQDIKESHDR